jgi:hypothetical protein
MANSRYGLRTHLGLIRSYSEGSAATDADATAFLDAALITDATITAAIQQLVIDLKTYGIWSKCKAIYPFVGGSASTHKWNLKDARDLDAAFRLVFSGGITHSSTGALFNGTTGYGDTKINSSSQLTKSSTHLSLYVRNNNNSGSPYDIANADNIIMTSNPTYLITRYSSNMAFVGIADESYGTSAASTNSTGFWCGATNGGTSQVLYRNGSSYATGTAGSGSLANRNLFLGAANAGGAADFFSNKEYAFASIGSGLSATEASNFNTAVQAFQTTLGRQV